jgi:hypothetical protein
MPMHCFYSAHDDIPNFLQINFKFASAVTAEAKIIFMKYEYEYEYMKILTCALYDPGKM